MPRLHKTVPPLMRATKPSLETDPPYALCHTFAKPRAAGFNKLCP